MPGGGAPSRACPHHSRCAGPGWPVTAPLMPPGLSVRVLRDVNLKERKEKIMGLDMYAFTLDRTPECPVDFREDDGQELHYWRKHPNLHGWMEQLYRAKGGSAPEFNCVGVQLTAADLDRLEQDVRTGNLPYTTGFFFGATDGTETEDDLTFIGKARDALSAGLTVFYTSWW